MVKIIKIVHHVLKFVHSFILPVKSIPPKNDALTEPEENANSVAQDER
jgi:hypothetical protein